MENEHSNNCKLTEHMVLTKTRANALSDITQINIWGFNLKDVSIFEKMENVEIVALSINHISSLQPFSKWKKLKQLLLRHNEINDFNQLDYLMNLPNLTNLSLIENPIAEDSNYRLKVIKKLPQLKTLDSIEISDNDRSIKLNSQPKIPASNQIDPSEIYHKDPVQPYRESYENEESQSSHKKHRKHRSVKSSERSNFIENEDFQQNKDNYNATKSYIAVKNNQKARTYNCQRDLNFSPKNICNGHNSILIAILSLLPELTNDDLNVVLNSVQQRIYLNQCE